MTAKIRVGETHYTVESILDEATQLLGEEVAKMRKGDKADSERLSALEKITKMATAISQDTRDALRGEEDAVDAIPDELRDELMPLIEQHMAAKKKKAEKKAA